MGKKTYLVVEDSYIGGRLIRAESPVSERIVEIETDVSKGGMTAESNLVECDADGNPVTDKKAKGAKAAKADDKPADDLA